MRGRVRGRVSWTWRSARARAGRRIAFRDRSAPTVHEAVGGFAFIVMRYPQRLQGAMVSTRSIDETSRRWRVSATFRERVAAGEGGAAVSAPRVCAISRAGLETLPSASAMLMARHALDGVRCCNSVAQARRCASATSVLKVFVVSVAPLALPICWLARSEMRCYICDRSGSPLPRRAWQRKAPMHPTSAPISRGGLQRRRRLALGARMWRYRGNDGVRFTVAGMRPWRPSPREVPASREARSTKSS